MKFTPRQTITLQTGRTLKKNRTHQLKLREANDPEVQRLMAQRLEDDNDGH